MHLTEDRVVVGTLFSVGNREYNWHKGQIEHVYEEARPDVRFSVRWQQMNGSEDVNSSFTVDYYLKEFQALNNFCFIPTKSKKLEDYF